MDQATIYSDNPGEQARNWNNQGCKWLHVVDLDGAFAKKSVNTEAILSILANSQVPVQLGGGIRDLNAIEYWLYKGIKRVILGSVAVKNSRLVYQACKSFPGQIVIGIDAKKGYVSTEGIGNLAHIEALRNVANQEPGIEGVIVGRALYDGRIRINDALKVLETC